MAGPVAIRWVAHVELSAIHAAYVVATGRKCTDAKAEQLLVEPVADINTRLVSSSIEISTFWKRLLHEIAFTARHKQCCEIALVAAGCSELQVEQTANVIGERLSECRMAFNSRFPKLAEQLDLRSRPLKDRWHTVGPGLLNDVALQIWSSNPPSAWWPSRIQGLLVQPMRGGDGAYDHDSNQFWIEAMLTDADPAVAEVIRVAWLVTNIAIETYIRDRSGEQSLARAWSLASIPLVLKAASSLGLIDSHELPILRAGELWHAADPSDIEVVLRWWQPFQEGAMPWPLALKALSQTLQSTRTEDPGDRSEPFDADFS